LVDRGGGRRQGLIVAFAMALSRPRRRAASIVLETEIDVLLEFAELIIQTVDVELHLLDLAVERPYLVLEPIDAHVEAGAILAAAAIAAAITSGDVGWRAIVQLRQLHIGAGARDILFQTIEATGKIALHVGHGGRREAQRQGECDRQLG
jgi:hypothetical protein